MHTLSRKEAQPILTRTAYLAIAAACVTMLLKFAAYWLTGSVGLLSDAVESTANLVAALTVLFALWFAARPVDRTHNYGHEKIEFFASGIEGIMILLAAAAIIWTALGRLVNPQALESIGAGAAIAIVASAINFGVALVLLRVARAHNSIVLQADGRHLLTDVLTSVGVVIGLALAHFSGIEQLDPIIAILIALNIIWTGYQLLRVAVDGLMDRALAADTVNAIQQAIDSEIGPQTAYHALRTRRGWGASVCRFPSARPGRCHRARSAQPDEPDRAGRYFSSPGCRNYGSHRADRRANRLDRQPAGRKHPGPVLVERNGHHSHHPAA